MVMDESIPIKPYGSSGFNIVLFGIFIAVTWISVLLRCYTRAKLAGIWGWDDSLLVIALVIYTAENICALVLNTMLDQKAALALNDMYVALGLLVAAECMYIAVMIILKLSFAIFLLRVLVDKRQRYVTIGTVTLVVIVGIAFLIYTIFQCGYPPSAEDIFLKSISGQCVSGKSSLALNWIHAIMNALTDMVFVALPTLVTWHLQLNRREKLVVTALFAVGAGSIVASFIRLKWIKNSGAFNLDFFADSKAYLTWSNIEEGCAITGASLVTLRKLVQAIFQNFFRSGFSGFQSSDKERNRTTRVDTRPTELLSQPQRNRSSSSAAAELGDFTFWNDNRTSEGSGRDVPLDLPPKEAKVHEYEADKAASAQSWA